MSTTDIALATRFNALFRGAQRSHGTYAVEDVSRTGPKHEIKRTAKTLREPATPELWAQHIAGTRPIGIVPIDEQDQCRWGAVDIDVYDLVHKDLVALLERLKIPALVCRTKSGGAHVYLFFAEAIPASLVMPRLRELAALLGYGDAEVFPKQDKVLLDRGDLGNWLNMPYFKGDDTDRYCFGSNGLGLSTRGFLAAAEALRINTEALAALPLHQSVKGFESGPPCIETLVSTGFGEGSRNNGLFALGVLAKKMNPDGWEHLLEEWNQAHMKPPLSGQEVGLVIRSLKKKEYTYKCTDQPIVSHCNLALCRTRPNGVGAGGVATILESATVMSSEPPLFFVNLKTGGTVEVDSKTLLDPRAFQVAALAQLHQVLPLYKLDDWLKSVQKVIENATRLEVPREVGTTGHFQELFEQFCTDRHRAEQRDEILLGKPWVDPESNRVIFRLLDLEGHLARARFTTYSRGQLTTKIRDMGGGSTQFDARGKNVRAWWVDADKLQWQTVAHAIPDGESSPI